MAGYQIRLESKRSAKTRLLLCTTGILLRRLQIDPWLSTVSHVFGKHAYLYLTFRNSSSVKDIIVTVTCVGKYEKLYLCMYTAVHALKL
jgi:hypothetical protein